MITFSFETTDLLGWTSLLDILSLKRVQSCFADMGLPKAIATEPDKMLGFAREIDLALNKGIYRQTMDAAAYNTAFNRLMSSFFENIASTYTPSISEELYLWANNYLIEENRTHWLAVWSYLFKRITGIIPKDEKYILPEIDAANLEVLVGLMDQYKVNIRANIIRLHEKRLIPQDDWEIELSVLKQEKVGDEPIHDQIDLLIDLVFNILESNQIGLVWEVVENTFATEAKAKLLKWGKSQLAAVNLPPLL